MTQELSIVHLMSHTFRYVKCSDVALRNIRC